MLYSKNSFIKTCERCFLCHSVVLCPSCIKCKKCCLTSSCRGKAPKLLADLAGSGGRSESGSHFERGLHPPLSNPAETFKVTHSLKQIRQSSQEQLPARGIAPAYTKGRCRISAKPDISRVFQPSVFGSETKQQMETHTGSEQVKSFPKDGKVQNGDPGNHQNLSPAGGMGYVCRLQGCLFPYPDIGTIQEVSEVSRPGSNLPIQGIALRPLYSTHRVHCSSEGGQTDGHKRGYKNPPVPRRLVGESLFPPNLSPTYSGPGRTMQATRLAGKHGKVGIGAQANIQFRRLPIRPRGRSGPSYTGLVAEPSRQGVGTAHPTGLPGPAIYVTDRFAHGHRETSSSRPVAYATYTMASQEKLEGSGIVGETNSHTKVSSSTSTMVVRRRQCPHRPAFTPHKTCSADLYRRIKRRVGRSLRRAYCKRNLVPTRNQAAYKLPRAQSSSIGAKRVQRPLYRQNSSCRNRQYHCGGLHKQGRRDEVGPALRASLENLDLVYQQSSHAQSPIHSRPSECSSGQAIQTGPDHSNGMVPPTRGFSYDMQKMAPTSSGLVQQEIAPVCVTGAGSPGLGHRCLKLTLGGSGRICLPTSSHSGQSSGEVAGHPMQANDSHCPGVAEHALVLGPGSHVQSSPNEPTVSAQPAHTAFQPDPSQESVESESPRMAPRATVIKKQGFSKAVAERIEAPQRRSTRSVYEAKWAIFTKWCDTNQVDFRAPPINSVADFLLYLFQDRKLQPSTIDGYRSAIVDKLGNSPIDMGKNQNLTRLLDSFHRDRPKGRRGIPSWNLSLVLHQLTKAPFEPIKEASLKHLTFKTVFLLALGSGKRRSEIHAWQNKNIRHQSDWSKVSLYPSPSFLSKNQLAKEGPESVAPVVIPALAPTLDRSLKSDRSLCPVRALRYYLDRTSDLRQNKELVFVSFKKGFDKDISSATISSWIKQTVILCYELSDQESHQLHKVKAHDVRAFTASKSFQSGVSLEQILSACHWKSHNTFTQFYLKDVAWADTELCHLGPVVAAQQIHK